MPGGRLIGDHGQESQLPFGYRTAYQFITIAENDTILRYTSVLPPNWDTLYNIAKLPPAEFDAAITEGVINPEMTRAQLRT